MEQESLKTKSLREYAREIQTYFEKTEVLIDETWKQRADLVVEKIWEMYKEYMMREVYSIEKSKKHVKRRTYKNLAVGLMIVIDYRLGNCHRGYYRDDYPVLLGIREIHKGYTTQEYMLIKTNNVKEVYYIEEALFKKFKDEGIEYSIDGGNDFVLVIRSIFKW